MSTLLKPWQDEKPSGYDLRMLQGDSQLIVVAGRYCFFFSWLSSSAQVEYSDSTSTTLTNALYELVQRPEHISTLRQEIVSCANEKREFSNEKLQKLRHLNGVISETLRLHTPIATALPRTTPPGGIKIGEIQIPEYVTVFCPQHAIGLSE